MEVTSRNQRGRVSLSGTHSPRGLRDRTGGGLLASPAGAPNPDSPWRSRKQPQDEATFPRTLPCRSQRPAQGQFRGRASNQGLWLRQRERTRERGPRGGVGGRGGRSTRSSWEQLRPLPSTTAFPAHPTASANGAQRTQVRACPSYGPASVSVPLSPAGGSPPSLSCRKRYKRTSVWG